MVHDFDGVSGILGKNPSATFQESNLRPSDHYFVYRIYDICLNFHNTICLKIKKPEILKVTVSFCIAIKTNCEFTALLNFIH